jgi:hypothetical protein
MKLGTIEKNVDFNNWNADQAEQLFELVRDIETYPFSKQSRGVEEGLRKDLNELKKFAKGEGQGIKDPWPFAKACCAWYERRKRANSKASFQDLCFVPGLDFSNRRKKRAHDVHHSTGQEGNTRCRC